MEKRRIAGKGEPEAARVCSNHLSLPNTMDAHHASLGRRTVQFTSHRFLHFWISKSSFLLFDYSFKSQLEEIRQKRAAERLIKTSSGPDLTQPSLHNGSHHLSLSLSHNQIIFFKILNIYIYIYIFFFSVHRFFWNEKIRERKSAHRGR